jgi:hypothetical protein
MIADLRLFVAGLHLAISPLILAIAGLHLMIASLRLPDADSHSLCGTVAKRFRESPQRDYTGRCVLPGNALGSGALGSFDALSFVSAPAFRRGASR